MSAARAVQRIFVVTSPGLERCLERELQALRVPGRMEAYPGGMMILGTQETLWRTVLQSRVAESVRMGVGDPFHSPTVEKLNQHLLQLPWEEYLRPEEAPAIRVTSDKSRLFHTGMVEQHVTSAIKQRLAPLANQTHGNHSESTELSSKRSSSPAVRVQLRHDECQVSIGASGNMSHRGIRKAVGEAPLRETAASACVLASPLLRRLTVASHSNEDLVLWDPFCGSGVIIQEALGLALGQPPGNSDKIYPFGAFPCHQEQQYRSVVDALQPTPHPALSRLRLLGSDRSHGQIEAARRNLHRLTRRLWKAEDTKPHETQDDAEDDHDTDESIGTNDGWQNLPCGLDFTEGSPAKLLQGLVGKPTMILTNVPFGIASGSKRSPNSGRTEALDAYGQLGRMLLHSHIPWRGVYCLVADVDSFKQHTGLEWSSELRFMLGERWVDLLQWTGRRTQSVPKTKSHEAKSTRRRGY